MAVIASREALRLGGNLNFGVGGVSVDYLVGAFIKSAAFANGVWTLTFQNTTGVEKTSSLPPGWLVSSTAPTSPYTGQGWYDTTAGSLKIYDGSSFESLTGALLADGSVSTAKLANNAVKTAKINDAAVTKAKLATGAVATAKLADDAVTEVKIKDDAVTTAKLDADNATKQDAFLARLNALRRDLNNIATLSPSAKRAVLIKLGAIIEGGRPIPSADYSGRVWFDSTNDQAHICRNFIEYTTAVAGGFADATVPSTVQIGEYVADLIAPTSIVQWAYTYGDNHFWVGKSGPGAGYHFSQTDDHTVLAKLVTGASSVGEWLGQGNWDGAATARLPTAGLPANREYFFWHTGTKTIRRLNPASYVAADSPIDHWKWVPVSANAANVFDWAETGNLDLIPVDKLPTEATSTLYLDDLYSMPGGPSEAVDIEGGRDGRFYKTVYGLDHNVRFNSITLQGKAPATYATYRIRLLKGNRTETDESVIKGGALLWPLTPTEQVEAQNVESTDLFERRFTFPAISLNRGEYLVVEWGRAYTDDGRCFVRVVRDLREHQAFTAFRFIGSGTDELDLSGNPTIDNVEWTNAGLWIKIDYEIEYDVGAAVAAHGNDDYAKTGVFALSQKELSLRVTRELGGFVDVPAIDLSAVGVPADSSIAEAQLEAAVQAKLKSDADVTTIANARALANYTSTEKTKLKGLGARRTDAEIKSLITGTNLSSLSGAVTDNQIPAAIMRDTEFTASAIRGLLDLTAQEVTDLFTGATINGQVITYTTNEGVDVTLDLPAGTAAADGVVESGAFSTDGRTLTLTLDTGGTVVIPVPALRTPTARGVHWGRVTFSTKADALTAILTASEFGYTPASDTPTGMAKVGDTITLPVDPPSDEIIGFWFVGSENGTDEVMSRLLLWGSIHRTTNWNSEDIYFNDGKVIRVIMSRNTTTGALLLTFQQIDGAIAATQTIDIYPVVTSGGEGKNSVIIPDDPANPIAPTAANANNLLFRNNNLFRQSVHHGTAGSITWEDVTNVSLPGYAGTSDTPSDLPQFTTVGEIHFVRRGGHFVKATDLLGTFVDYVPPGFIGSWTDQADATRHATKIGNIAGFIASSGPNTTQLFPYIVTAYTAPTKSIRIWVRTDGDFYFGFRVGGIGAGESRILELVKASGVADRVSALGVQVVFHATRADYNAASATDGKLHIVTAV